MQYIQFMFSLLLLCDVVFTGATREPELTVKISIHLSVCVIVVDKCFFYVATITKDF